MINVSLLGRLIVPLLNLKKAWGVLLCARRGIELTYRLDGPGYNKVPHRID